MDLNFGINNQILARIDKNILVNKSVNYVFCNFEFKTSDWDGFEKFVIFKDSWGRAYTQHIGTNNIFRCAVPHEALHGTYFKVSLYAGDNESLITTNELMIMLVPSGYTTNINSSSNPERDVFIEIFDELAEKIDNIVYEDGYLRCYAGEKVVSEVMLIVDDSLSTDSINPIQNRVVKNALDLKSELGHTHIIDDVTDYEERNDNEFSLFCRELSNKIRSR